MLSRAKPAIGPGSSTPAKDQKKKKQLPKVDDFLSMRDYTGAITLLEVYFCFFVMLKTICTLYNF